MLKKTVFGLCALTCVSSMARAQNPTITPVVRTSAANVKGFDKYQWTLTVQEIGTQPKPFWFWAHQVGFTGPGAGLFYMGLQPNGEYGKTALFSFFGPHTASTNSSCASGADNGSGTSCHIAYPWKTGVAYTFTVSQVSSDPKSGTTWSATISDGETGQATVIGVVTVPAVWGLMSPNAKSWAEWFEDSRACEKRTYFNVFYNAPVGFFDNVAYPETVTGTSSGSCATYLPATPTSTTMFAGAK